MNTKFLYANGDSFGFGQELDGRRATDDIYRFSDYQRHHCYSGVIADKFGWDYQNESLPGGSNQRIYRTTLTTVSELLKTYQQNEIFVTIILTHSHRREFYNRQWKNYYPHMPTVKPGYGPCNVLWTVLTNYFHDAEADNAYDQLMILGLQNFLKTNKVPYLMSWSMHHLINYEDERQHIPESLLMQRYAKRFYQEPSFAYHVFHELGLQRAEGGHPLTDGHAAWAEHLLDYIESTNLFDNGDL